MSEPQTEYPFTLPVGLADGDGVRHREGSMRLATARDQIEPQSDARVRENGAYLSVLKLARVLTNVGAIQPVTPTHVEQLYAADFAHLERLYEQINATATGASAHSHDASDTRRAPAPPRPPALAGVSESLPIGLLRERDRAADRKALMRDTGTIPRRGRVHEGPKPHTQALDPDTTPRSAGPPSKPPVRELSPRPAGEPSAEPAGESSAELAGEPSAELTGEPSAEPLMRLSSHPPLAPAAADSTKPATGFASPAVSAGARADMEDVYEKMIVRLRRELLVERERMGAPFGV